MTFDEFCRTAIEIAETMLPPTPRVETWDDGSGCTVVKRQLMRYVFEDCGGDDILVRSGDMSDLGLANRFPRKRRVAVEIGEEMARAFALPTDELPT